MGYVRRVNTFMSEGLRVPLIYLLHCPEMRTVVGVAQSLWLTYQVLVDYKISALWIRDVLLHYVFTV